MTIYTCNDHQNAAVCFTSQKCPLCAAIEYHDRASGEIDGLKSEIDSLRDEVKSLEDEAKERAESE